MKKLIILMIGASAVAGCAVNPKASMFEVSSPAHVAAQQQNVAGTFYLQSNRLDISFAERAANPAQPARASEDAGAGTAPGREANRPAAPAPTPRPPGWALSVTNEATESRNHRFILVQHGDLLSRTTLLMTKRPNTDLISSIGSEVTDNRIALLQNVASVAKVAIGLVGVSGDDLEPFSASFSLADHSVFVAGTPRSEGEEAG